MTATNASTTSTTTVAKAASRTSVSVLDTIGNTAERISNVVDTVGYSIDMLTSFVQKHREKQEVQTELEMERFYATVEDQHNLELAKIQNEIAVEIKNNPDLIPFIQEAAPRTKSIVDKMRTKHGR